MSSVWRRRRRLADHASLIHEIDLAILREGGVETLSHDEMRWVSVHYEPNSNATCVLQD